jgi:two-component system LytT family response regulator
MSLRVLIVDDEPLARDRLRGFLAAEDDVEVIGECSNGLEALTAIRIARPEVVFLDVQMPGCDGLEMVQRLPQTGRPLIVFVSAHERYALEAFQVEAVDYLLKPFDRERLGQALRRVNAQRATPPAEAAAPERTPAPSAVTSLQERVAFKADGKIVFFRAGEIIRVEANDNYVMLYLADSRLLVRETLTALEARLGPAGFVRVNRSALVQLEKIREVQPALNGDYTVVLSDGTKLPLSRNLRAEVERRLGS